MLPILLDLGFFKIYTLGIFLVIAFFWALFWFWRNIKLTSFKEEAMFDGVFVSMLGGIFFARLTYVLLNFEDFGGSILKFILVNGYPGLSLVGGLIGAFFTFLVFARIARLPFFEAVAYAIPSLFLALGIGKIGAFFGGSTVGSETDFLLSIQYVGYEGQRHITAIYDAILMFVGFFISQSLVLRYRRDKVDVGSIFSFFLVMLSIAYMSLDFIKDDPLYLFNLRFNVLVPGIVTAIVLVWEIIKYRKNIVKKFKEIGKKNGKK